MVSLLNSRSFTKCNPMDALISHISAILSSIGWFALILLVWNVARAFGRLDDAAKRAMENHLPHIQDSLTKIELHQETVGQELRGLRDDIRSLK